MVEPIPKKGLDEDDRVAMIADIRHMFDQAMEAHREDLRRLVSELRVDANYQSVSQGGGKLISQMDDRDAEGFVQSQRVEEEGAIVCSSEDPHAHADESAAVIEEGAEEGLHSSNAPARSSVLSARPKLERRSSITFETFSYNFISNKAASRKARTKGGQLGRFVHSSFFENMSGGIILVNAIVIGVHAHQRAQNPGMCEDQWPNAFLVFSILFLIELVLRLIVFQKAYFFGPDRGWNLFDIVIVFGGLFEDVVSRIGNGSECGEDGMMTSSPNSAGSLASSISILRILRVLRVVRMVKAFRKMSVFRDLRIMVHSTLNCLMPLFWSCVLLAFVHWCFSVYFIHLAADHITDAIAKDGKLALQDDQVIQARRWFGSLPGSMYTLFMSITGGTNWESPAEALTNISGQAEPTLLYMFFIALTAFAVLNVITGVFVENATNCAKKDREVTIQTALKNRDMFVKDVLAVFHEADQDNSGNLTLDEFRETLNDARVKVFLESLGLDGVTAEQMYSLLDPDQAGFITLDEFISGCSALKGDAKATDVALLRMDMLKRLDFFETSMQRLEVSLQSISRRQSAPGAPSNRSSSKIQI